MRVYEHRSSEEDDYLFQHLDGVLSTKQFWTKFKDILQFTDEEARFKSTLFLTVFVILCDYTYPERNSHDILCRNT